MCCRAATGRPDCWPQCHGAAHLPSPRMTKPPATTVLAALNKSLAKSNKSCAGEQATKRRKAMNSRPKTGAMKMNTHFPKSVALTIGTWAFVAFFVVFGTITNASAATFGEDEGGQMFTHNGSLMRMVTLPYGRGIEIRYEEPRAGLQDVGVRQGTLLFRGNWRGNTLVGQALVVPNGCRSVPYEVKGYV